MAPLGGFFVCKAALPLRFWTARFRWIFAKFGLINLKSKLEPYRASTHFLIFIRDVHSTNSLSVCCISQRRVYHKAPLSQPPAQEDWERWFFYGMPFLMSPQGSICICFFALSTFLSFCEVPVWVLMSGLGGFKLEVWFGAWMSSMPFFRSRC